MWKSILILSTPSFRNSIMPLLKFHLFNKETKLPTITRDRFCVNLDKNTLPSQRIQTIYHTGPVGVRVVLSVTCLTVVLNVSSTVVIDPTRHFLTTHCLQDPLRWQTGKSFMQGTLCYVNLPTVTLWKGAFSNWQES